MGLALDSRLGDPELALHLLFWEVPNPGTFWSCIGQGAKGRKLRPQDLESGSLGEGELVGAQKGGLATPLPGLQSCCSGSVRFAGD